MRLRTAVCMMVDSAEVSPERTTVGLHVLWEVEEAFLHQYTRILHADLTHLQTCHVPMDCVDYTSLIAHKHG